MEAGTPWMEPLDLEPSDLPMEMADFFGLDKDGSFEQLVEIRSPVQELENVEHLPAFCMMEPEVHIDAPVLPEAEPTSPEDQNVSETPDDLDVLPPPEVENVMATPDVPNFSPSPEDRNISPPPEDRNISPSLEDRNVSPTPDFFLEPIVQITTPDVEILEPEERQALSPEVHSIDDSPEKQDDHHLTMEDQSMETSKQPLCDEPSKFKSKQELIVRLKRIDETLTIINNKVTLPPHMCGSDSRSHAASSSSKSRGRRNRTTINRRTPYSLRIKPEPIDDDDVTSYSNEVRFNPYALSAQKTTTNKRTSAAKAKQTKGKQIQPALPQPDEGDDFLPTDFLEASMSEGVSSTKQQSWPGSLLEKTLKSGAKRQPAQTARNGTSMYVNRADGGDKPGMPLHRLSSFRGGIVQPEAGDASSYDSVAKVMANSSVSITNVPKMGKAVTIVSARKGPGQTGMVNHDHLYSTRLSNENVTRLETQIKTLQAENRQIKTLQAENRVMKVQMETLTKQLKAANEYIATSLNAAIKPPPLRPYVARPQRAVQQSRPVRLQALRVQAMLPQAIRGMPFRGRAQGPRNQIRLQQTIRPRAPLTIAQRPGNPGVMVIPAQTLRPLTASTQALTVIPIRRGSQPPEPDIVMPAFEQVNVNEHFGMHFLTE